MSMSILKGKTFEIKNNIFQDWSHGSVVEKLVLIFQGI